MRTLILDLLGIALVLLLAWLCQGCASPERMCNPDRSPGVIASCQRQQKMRIEIRERVSRIGTRITELEQEPSRWLGYRIGLLAGKTGLLNAEK